MPTRTRSWDAAEYLDNDEVIAAYLAAAFGDGDPRVIAVALGDVARAKGLAVVAAKSGLSQQSLVQSLSAEGAPDFDTVMKVVDALGLQLAPKPRPVTAPEAA